MPYHLSGKPGGQYKWLADPAEVNVYVLEGVHGDAWEEHRTTLLAQTTTKAHLAEIGRKLMKPEKCHDTNGVPFEQSTQPAVPGCYTYVALRLGRLWIQVKNGEWWRT